MVTDPGRDYGDCWTPERPEEKNETSADYGGGGGGGGGGAKGTQETWETEGHNEISTEKRTAE